LEAFLNIPDWTKLAEEVEKLLDTDVVAVHHQYASSIHHPYSICHHCLDGFDEP
jgi:hypothetical protein